MREIFLSLKMCLMTIAVYCFHQLLCLVGEAFDDYSDEVCGAVVNIRNKGDKIAVWTSDYENREAVTHIG